MIVNFNYKLVVIPQQKVIDFSKLDLDGYSDPEIKVNAFKNAPINEITKRRMNVFGSMDKFQVEEQASVKARRLESKKRIVQTSQISLGSTHHPTPSLDEHSEMNTQLYQSK